MLHSFNLTLKTKQDQMTNRINSLKEGQSHWKSRKNQSQWMHNKEWTNLTNWIKWADQESRTWSSSKLVPRVRLNRKPKYQLITSWWTWTTRTTMAILQNSSWVQKALNLRIVTANFSQFEFFSILVLQIHGLYLVKLWKKTMTKKLS